MKYIAYEYILCFISERAKQTEATGDRFEEAKNINKSLMTLGTVIHGKLKCHGVINASLYLVDLQCFLGVM